MPTSTPWRVEQLSHGEIPIVEDGLEELVKEGLASGNLRFTTDSAGAAATCEFAYLCVPTPQSHDGHADLSHIEAAATVIGPVLPPESIVVNKSTVPVGSTRVVERVLGRSDVFVVSNPEFLREGSAVHDFLHPDRIVIGSDDQSAAIRVASLYLGIASPPIVTDPASAETIKYASNAFLATKVSFVNAIAAVCEAVGADVNDVVLGMGYDPRIGHQFLRPGPGWGGSCLPKDTRALVSIAEDGGYDFDLLKGVITVNEQQLERVVTKVCDSVAEARSTGSTVAAWGLAFKARTDDLRDSPALDIIRRLTGRGATVRAYDPAVHSPIEGIEVCADPYAACEDADVLVVLTEWDEFRWLDLDKVAAAMTGMAIVDSRNVLDRAAAATTGVQLPGHRPLMPTAGEGGRRIVVTGGAGFLGSHMCERLLDRGDSVIAVDNLVSGAISNLEHLFGRAGFTYIHHDVSEYIWVPGHVDAVLHLASPASPIDFSKIPIQILKVGSLGTHNSLGLARAKGAKFQLNSTSEVYGDPLVHPQPETYWGNVNPIGPRGVYDEAKRFAEAMTMAYHRAHDLDVRIVRTFNTYGPRMRPDDGRVVTNFIVQALRGEPLTLYGDGTQTRSFCYVDDQIDGQVALLDSSYVGPVNIGNPDEYTVAQFAQLVIEITGSHSTVEYRPLPQDDPLQRQPDITLARTQLGWEPKVDVREGLTRTVDWFRSHLAR